MALTFTTFSRQAPQKGGWRRGMVDITLDGAYPTGGWPITADNLGLSTLRVLIPSPFKAGYAFEWDHAAGKLKAYKFNYPSASAGVAIEASASEAGLNGLVLRCVYEGS